MALALAVALGASFAPVEGAQAQQGDEVARLMERMSNAAKVGQLFVVAFPGATVTEDAAITELIREYRVGGVVLEPDNGNIVNEGDTPAQVATLVSQLQDASWEATRAVTETLADPFVPLFVAASHEGNGMPHTSIVSGTTPLPSEMALGATWNLSHTETIGQIAGRELSALGVNMLLGPSLDVLEEPRPESAGDLGVRAFGGEPFWVGQMGKAYIRGLHTGADGRIAVVAKHFPGLGASDRSLDEEAPTVQRTLERLRQVDLAPFFAVAQAEDPAARPDAVMVSHIRFRGLEGGRFVTTRPISVDSQWLQALLELPELSGWREAGGVTISDQLGLRALRRFYDPTEQSFNSRRIAREAFLAGNDLLLLSQFAPTGDWEDQIDNAKSTIAFFREKYESEPSFQAQVDAAVARILRLKLRIYGGSFSLPDTQPDAETVGEAVGLATEKVSAIGRNAVTLLSPPSPDLVPSPPTPEDNIVIFTDARERRPCSTCHPAPYIDPLSLESTIVRLYGPDATGQVTPSLVRTFTFGQLEEYLNTPAPTPTPTPAAGEQITPTLPQSVGGTLQTADWILFAMLDPKREVPQSGIVRRFLAEQAGALAGPNLVVLAYDAPYYLDATEISKLKAYYVAYSQIEPFIEASVRALFGEFAPLGKPPVSVSGINYDLSTQTSPNPEQTIPLYYSIGEAPEEGQPTPAAPEEGQPTPEPPKLEVGDELRLRTGVIVDHNGHPVPDGTPVQFIFTYPQEGLEQTAMKGTAGGIAETSVPLERTGQLDIFVQADPVPRNLALQVTIREGEPATIVTPTPVPTPTPTPTATPTPEPEKVEQTPSPTPTAEKSQPIEEENEEKEDTAATRSTTGLDLGLALIGAFAVSGSGYYAMRLDKRSVVRAVRVALWCVVGGLALYVAYVLPLPGAAWLRGHLGPWAAGGVALVGGAVPLMLTWLFGRSRQ